VTLRSVGADEYVRLAGPWYADPEVLRWSEGGAAPYGPAELRRMYDALTRQGELYVIEVDGVAIGDAALLPDSLPIVIEAGHRSRGYGAQVLQLLIARARELGWREVRVRSIDPDNVRSVRLYARAGFAGGVLRL